MSVSNLLEETFEIVREDYPRRYSEMIGSLEERVNRRGKTKETRTTTVASVRLDGEHMELIVQDGRVRVARGKSDDDEVGGAGGTTKKWGGVRTVTSAETVLALLDGKVTLEGAIEADDLLIFGDPDSVEAFAMVVETVLSVAPSSSRIVGLLRRFRGLKTPERE